MVFYQILVVFKHIQVLHFVFLVCLEELAIFIYESPLEGLELRAENSLLKSFNDGIEVFVLRSVGGV